MRLIKATDDFKLNGQPYPEFPLIVKTLAPPEPRLPGVLT